MKELQWLFVTPFYKPAHVYGGPTFSIPTLCQALVEEGIKVTVFTTNANGQGSLPVPSNVLQDVDGVQVHYFERDLPGSYFYSAQLRSACYERINGSAFDLVYVASNWGYPFLPACRAAHRAKIPYIVSPRASFKRNTWKGKFLKKMTYHLLFERRHIQKASYLHYTTTLETDDSRWLRLKPAEVIVPNPVKLEEFERLPARGGFRKSLNLPADKKMILILGRIDPDKGLDLGLQAFARLLQQFPDLLLVIAGPEENGYVRVLQKMAEELKIGGHVLFPGLLSSSQRLEALVDADIFFSPSRSENFGMSIVEAMACKLPVIVSDQVGVADVISEEKAGLVVPLDPVRMADALMKILGSDSLGQQLGEKAAKMVRKRFASRSIARSLLRVFGEVVD